MAVLITAQSCLNTSLILRIMGVSSLLLFIQLFSCINTRKPHSNATLAIAADYGTLELSPPLHAHNVHPCPCKHTTRKNIIATHTTCSYCPCFRQQTRDDHLQYNHYLHQQNLHLNKQRVLDQICDQKQFCNQKLLPNT